MKAMVEVQDMSKLYHLGSIGAQSLHESFKRWFGQPTPAANQREFWALKKVSFDVQPGEVVGIIGRNGAGKSTLLKILSRITEPTSGRAILRGRIASLLEVGTGFHPELTGRENIFLNGAILGMKRAEIARKLDEIVAFADIPEFLDTPVKRYSSGMYVRLAFAVAAHLDPEILIVDEVLAVGDAEFQKKCLGKMKEVSQGSGRTVLFVSHNMNAVMNLCSRAVLLQGGTVRQWGETAAVVTDYLATGAIQGSCELWQHPNRSPSTTPHFVQLDVTDQELRPRHYVTPGEIARIALRIRCAQPIWNPRVSIGFTNATGERIFAVANFLSSSVIEMLDGECTVAVTFRVPPVVPSQFTLDVGLSDGAGQRLDEIYSAACLDVAENNYLRTSHPYFREMGHVLVPSEWEAATQPQEIAHALEH